MIFFQKTKITFSTKNSQPFPENVYLVHRFQKTYTWYDIPVLVSTTPRVMSTNRKKGVKKKHTKQCHKTAYHFHKTAYRFQKSRSFSTKKHKSHFQKNKPRIDSRNQSPFHKPQKKKKKIICKPTVSTTLHFFFQKQ